MIRSRIAVETLKPSRLADFEKFYPKAYALTANSAVAELLIKRTTIDIRQHGEV